MDRAFLSAARSLLWVLADPRRYRAAMAAIAGPVLLVHGDRDRLVPVAAARDAPRGTRTGATSSCAGVGHVPQLQVPEVAAEVLDWLRDRGAPRGGGLGEAASAAQRVAQRLEAGVARPPAELLAAPSWCP